MYCFLGANFRSISCMCLFLATHTYRALIYRSIDLISWKLKISAAAAIIFGMVFKGVSEEEIVANDVVNRTLKHLWNVPHTIGAVFCERMRCIKSLPLHAVSWHVSRTRVAQALRTHSTHSAVPTKRQFNLQPHFCQQKNPHVGHWCTSFGRKNKEPWQTIKAYFWEKWWKAWLARASDSAFCQKKIPHVGHWCISFFNSHKKKFISTLNGKLQFSNAATHQKWWDKMRWDEERQWVMPSCPSSSQPSKKLNLSSNANPWASPLLKNN